MEIKIYSKSEQIKNPDFLKGVIIPNQTHSNNIIEIIFGKEDLKNCDGVFTSRENNFKLAIRTADCTAITFIDKYNYGIIHAGWRGLVNGIIEKMLEKFDNPEIFVAPFEEIGNTKRFLLGGNIGKILRGVFDHPQPLLNKEGSNKIIFNFEKALKSVLGDKAIFDKRDTLEDSDFYSYRRDKTKERNYTILENK
ncbi:MAG: polyphenol oxidase family protein [Candidatus Gracilibacteria bacterium]|nr:polyphenol oxidase family protein [Candidatus Gracilibacteria bacterium]